MTIKGKEGALVSKPRAGVSDLVSEKDAPEETAKTKRDEKAVGEIEKDLLVNPPPNVRPGVLIFWSPKPSLSEGAEY